MSPPFPQLRALSFGSRLGLTFLCFVLLGGIAASLAHLYLHDHKRDERPGLTVDDVKGVYHGIRSKSPLLVALERGHPETLKTDDRDRLMKWLTGKDLSRTYDDIDLGDKSPQALIADNCLSCHKNSSTDPAARAVLLESDDDVLRQSISRDISPNSTAIVVASTHVHATTLAIVGFAVVMLAACTRFGRGLVGSLTALCGIGLAADIGGWWLTRHHEQFAYLIMAGGAAFTLGTVLLVLLILADLWLPRRSG
ncbi:MAG: hypothetical protein JNK25_11705 [Phycisphaerae bacterium]|nr:hypothetical protein [Phycisphaerae bacterium]